MWKNKNFSVLFFSSTIRITPIEQYTKPVFNFQYEVLENTLGIDKRSLKNVYDGEEAGFLFTGSGPPITCEILHVI